MLAKCLPSAQFLHVGEMSVSQMSAFSQLNAIGQIFVIGQMPVGQMPVGQMPVGQMPVGQMSAFGLMFSYRPNVCHCMNVCLEPNV
jgi:hypothetical protein